MIGVIQVQMTTFAAQRLHILCIKITIIATFYPQQRCSPSYT